MTICLVNNKQYIGVHETLNPDKFDGYLGNGVFINRPATYKKSKTPFQSAVNKYGVDKFKRITLNVFDSKEEAYKLESELITEEYIKREDTYNIKLGGEGGCPENLKVKVYMYDLNGNFVKEFDTVTDAGRYLKVPFMKKFKKKQYTGKRIGNKTNHEFEKIPIGRYDLDGNLIETYDCLRSCRNAGFLNAKKVLTGERKTCKGYIFKYLNN